MKLIRYTLQWLLIAMTMFALTACETVPRLEQAKTVVIAPEDSQLLDCLVAAPPDKAVYVAATPKEREKMLIELAEKNYKNAFLCNDRWGKLRDWKKKQLENYQKNNPKGG